mmetsp:Transcript_55069/g.151613  ORF Transcript_55069/g.151613 Transcript_55069/m.151613 type:complete len:133 (+) Transcript_55069:78-476(+)
MSIILRSCAPSMLRLIGVSLLLLTPVITFAPPAAVPCRSLHRGPRAVPPGGSDGENENVAGGAPQSPCNSICRYKRDFFDGQVCIGCHRDIFEIKNWVTFSTREKEFALLDVADRAAAWELHLREKGGESTD